MSVVNDVAWYTTYREGDASQPDYVCFMVSNAVTGKEEIVSDKIPYVQSMDEGYPPATRISTGV